MVRLQRPFPVARSLRPTRCCRSIRCTVRPGTRAAVSAADEILLDAGASSLFLKNAEKLGCEMSRVEYAVLSHAHYDHATGMADFFAANETARFFLREGAAETPVGISTVPDTS